MLTGIQLILYSTFTDSNLIDCTEIEWLTGIKLLKISRQSTVPWGSFYMIQLFKTKNNFKKIIKKLEIQIQGKHPVYFPSSCLQSKTQSPFQERKHRYLFAWRTLLTGVIVWTLPVHASPTSLAKVEWGKRSPKRNKMSVCICFNLIH